MASTLMASRSGLRAIQRSGVASPSVARTGAVAVRPFTTRRPAHGARIPTRAAETQAEVEHEADDNDFDEIFAGMLEEDNSLEEGEEEVEVNDEQLEAFMVGDELNSTSNAEILAEAFMAAELADGDAVEEARLRRRGELVFLEASEGRGGSEADQNAVMEKVAAHLAESAAQAEDVDDVQIAHGFSAYDEDEEAGMTPAQKEAIQQFKLSKAELKNLLPATWDSVAVDFFTTKKELSIPLPEFKLNVLWMEKNIAVAVDQVYSRGQTSPLTEYYFWPRKDAWEELKIGLEAKPWILERDKVVLLNRLTQIINFWQDDQEKHTMEEARATFPDCSFSGA